MSFMRQVIVEFGVPGESARRFTKLRISGEVKKSRGRNANTAAVSIYNPSPDAIAFAQREGTMMRVLAGYEVPRLIFAGDINRGGVELSHDEVDRVLSIEAQDGGRRLREARVDTSFSAEVTAEQVFGTLAKALNVPLGNVRVESDARWPRGLTLSLPARDALDEVCQRLGVRWSIQDGLLQVLPLGEDTGEVAVVVSAANGNLIGSPRPLDKGLEITALLDGRIRPGRRFIVESRDYQGTYIATEVKHTFDSGWDTSFYTVITGRET